MDEIVEQGFERLCAMVSSAPEQQKETADKIIEHSAELLKKMAAAVAPIAAEIGQEFLLKAKQDPKGELYDQKFHPDKMLILGKSAEPVSARPDDMKKKVDQQFCVLTEKGEMFELMFSSDGFIIDSYASPLTAEDALAFYGNDIIYMLYSAMRDYALAQEDLLDALNLTLGYIQNKTE